MATWRQGPGARGHGQHGQLKASFRGYKGSKYPAKRMKGRRVNPGLTGRRDVPIWGRCAYYTR